METPAVIREVFRRPGVAHTQHPMVEEPAGPSGNGGVVLPSQSELFLLGFPPTAAPVELFYGRIIPPFIGGLLLWVSSEEAERGPFYFHICLLVFHPAAEVLLQAGADFLIRIGDCVF